MREAFLHFGAFLHPGLSLNCIEIRLLEPEVSDGDIFKRRYDKSTSCCLGDGLGAVARIGLVSYLIKVKVNRSLSDPKDGGYLPGCFTLTGPE